jgi:hypothetical protein
MYKIESTPKKLSVTVTIENPTTAPVIAPPFMNFLRELIFSGLLKTLDDLDAPEAVKQLIHSLSFLDCYLESAASGQVDPEENGEALKVIPVIVNALEALGVGFDG